MNTYAIIDIGSNTIVLAIYAVNDKQIQQLQHYSTPAHLVDYIQEQKMDEAGLNILHETIKQYVQICKDLKINEVHVDITECGRNISNHDAFMQAIIDAGIHNAKQLTGEEEAICDYYGSRLDNNTSDGILIDIGGGSTEIVCFEDSKIVDAVSIPLGCVRLSHHPLDPSYAREAIEQMRKSHPKLTNQDIAIGVGGTIRSCKKICKEVYGAKGSFTSEQLHTIYDGLRKNDPELHASMLRNVKPDRQPVFVPGLGMLVAFADSFDIKEFHNSDYGVREGYLLHEVLKITN